MSAPRHVVLGTGALGAWTARGLRAKGHAVRAVNRSGVRPPLLPDDVELVALDARDAGALTDAAADARTIIDATDVPDRARPADLPAIRAAAVAAAEAHGATYLALEPLDLYDPAPPVNEESRVAPAGPRGALQRRLADDLAAAHDAGRVRAVTLRAGPAYGPGVVGSPFGERFVADLLAGRAVRWVGEPDVPQAAAYAPDVGRAAAELATYESALGRVWIAPHAPAIAPRAFAALVAEAGGAPPPTVRPLGPWALRVAAAFRRDARAHLEDLPARMRPYHVDARRIDAVYALKPTRLELGIAATVAWLRDGTLEGAAPFLR